MYLPTHRSRVMLTALLVLAMASALVGAPPARGQESAAPTGAQPTDIGHRIGTPQAWAGAAAAQGQAPTDPALAQAGPAQLAWSAPLPLPLPTGTVRLAGPGRAETAAEVSRATFAPGLPTVFVATGDAFPDALAGGPAAARGGSPILLVTADEVPAATRTELQRLAPARIVLLGGTIAIGADVEAELGSLAPTVMRLAGGDRAATAAAISRDTFPGGAPVAFIATGTDFPDALAGGPAAAQEGGPLLLTLGDQLPPSTRAEIERLAPQRLVLLGGTAAIDQALATQLATLAPTVERVAGHDRVATATAVAARFLPAAVGTAFLTTGGAFPDALSAAPVAAAHRAPLLLTTAGSLPDATRQQLQRLRPSTVVAVGGEAAVAGPVLAAAGQAITVDAPPAAASAAVDDGDLAALRAAVGTDPQQAYAVVRELLDHTPTYPGIAKGPSQTLVEGGGNAWDLALLLIDLLQSAGTTTRLATGRVTLTAEEMTAWMALGAPVDASRPLLLTHSDPVVITVDGQRIAGSDIPFDPAAGHPQVAAVEFDHVWVEALISAEWTAMDASFRSHQLFAGRNVAADAGLDTDGFVQQLLEAAVPLDPTAGDDPALAAARVADVDIEEFADVRDARFEQVLDWLQANDPAVSLSDALGGPRRIAGDPRIGAEPLPADTATEVQRFDAPGAEHRQHVVFELGGTEVLLPHDQVAGRRVSVHFLPADQAAQDAITANGGILGLAEGSIDLRPQLLLDGQPATDAPMAATRLGRRVELEVDYGLGPPDAGGEALGTSTYSMVAGGSYALVAPVGPVGRAELAASRDRLQATLGQADVLSDAVMGEALHALGLSHFATEDLNMAYLAGTQGAAAFLTPRGLLIGHGLSTTDQQSVAAGAFTMDSQRGDIGLLDRIGGRLPDTRAILLAAGVIASTFEHDTFERGLGIPALSTMEVLADAAAEGTLLRIDASNADALDATSVSLLQYLRLRQALSAGAELLIPAGEQRIGDWTGTGWALHHPGGSTEYIISGDLNGGATILDLVGLDPGQQEALLASAFGTLIAFLDGLLLGDLNVEGYDQPLLELSRAAGQLLSALLNFGDVRDLILAAIRGDATNAALALIGLIPGAELRHGIAYIDEVADLALRNPGARDVLTDTISEPALITGIIGQVLRHTDDGQADVDRADVCNVQATRVVTTIAGVTVTSYYISISDTPTYLTCIGLNPANVHADTISGVLGDSVAEGLADDRGWTRLSMSSSPSQHGIDALYELPDGTSMITEHKGTTTSGAKGRILLRATLVNQGVQYQLSITWLLGSPPRTGVGAIDRSVPHRIDDQQRIDLLADVNNLSFSREVVIARTRPHARPVTAALFTQTGIDGSDSGPPATTSVVHLFTPDSR